MNLLSPAFIELNSELKNKSHALKFLVNKLDDKGCLSDKREYFDAVLKREELLSTYCGYNIAIPHAISKAVKKVSFGFCRTVSLEWDKNDDEVKKGQSIIEFYSPKLEDQINSTRTKLELIKTKLNRLP